MNTNKIKRFINKYLPLIIVIIISIILLVISFIFPKETLVYIYLSIVMICIILRIIIELIMKGSRIKLPITNKTSIIEKLYNFLNLEKTNIIVSINTKDETILKNTKKLFPGSRESKIKDIYSISLPMVNLELLKLYLKNNDPEKIIIHQFASSIKKDKKTITRALSICIDKELIIQFNTKVYPKKEIKELKKKLIEK